VIELCGAPFASAPVRGSTALALWRATFPMANGRTAQPLLGAPSDRTTLARSWTTFVAQPQHAEGSGTQRQDAAPWHLLPSPRRSSDHEGLGKAERSWRRATVRRPNDRFRRQMIRQPTPTRPPERAAAVYEPLPKPTRGDATTTERRRQRRRPPCRPKPTGGGAQPRRAAQPRASHHASSSARCSTKPCLSPSNLARRRTALPLTGGASRPVQWVGWTTVDAILPSKGWRT
jgi:hypothetical protein